MNVLQSTYDELKAECDALAIKAARYDWLRISADISWNGWVTHSMLAATDAERAELDSAIDSAMASSGYEVNTRHGAGDADHSPDAGKMADDRSAELTTAWMAGVESVRERAA